MGAGRRHYVVRGRRFGPGIRVAKASLNDPADAPAQSPLVTVWVRARGAWHSATAYTVADDVTRPQLMVDPVLGQVATYWHASVVVER